MAEDRLSIDKLDVDNYGTWSVQMKWLLIENGLWAPVEQEEPEDKDKDQKALARIGRSVQNHHVAMLAKCKTAKEAWTKLEVVYKAKSNAKRLQLKTELLALKKQASEPVTKYVARASGFRDQLAAVGDDVKDEDLVLYVLRGLPAQYNTVVTLLTVSDDKLDLDNVLAKLLTIEQTSAPVEETKAYYSGSWSQGRGGAYARHAHDNNQAARVAATRGREQRICHYCGIKGHLKKDCRKMAQDHTTQPRPTTTPALVSRPGQRGNVERNVAFTTAPAVDPTEWILDSGASRHVSGDVERLINVRPAPQGAGITTATGALAEARCVGDMVLSGLQGLHVDKLILRGVLGVPGSSVNLISIFQVLESGADMKVAADRLDIFKDGQPVLTAPQRAGVWSLRAEPARALAAKVTPELWHRRFGHLGYDNLAKLSERDMIKGISVTPAEFKEAAAVPCEPCIKAKQHKLPHPPSNSDTRAPLELLHMDVCGPIQVPSLGGSVYLATFLDDYSKLSIVRPLHSKAEVAAEVMAVIELLENQLGSKVLVARTDNGTEYVNKALSEYFARKGILHQTTVRYTPEQNGAAERLNRTLMEKVRAMLEDSGLPKELWAEAAVTASYIRNRSPVAGRAHTPWELFL
ncbi:hypothetical protein WJX72_003845 [[Myrmecia] bisecta]|uniref:Uncharacterized protein n=1 Tax=[Myrmecia] bisecta TaxID=41462 RepID=A0AAW1PD55_9CHLO